MKIVTKMGEEVIYQQLLDDSKTLNTTVSTMMQQPSGDAFVTTVSNNGHDMIFRNASLDIQRVVRSVNGIITKAKTAKPVTA